MTVAATADTRRTLTAMTRRLIDTCDPRGAEPLDFLRARYDAGLAWVHYPRGLGGLGLRRSDQDIVDDLLAQAAAPDNDPVRNGIGLGMAAPTILAHGTTGQRRRFLRPLWTGEEMWCQLFSEPGAGSDLADLATRATNQGGEWVVNGQKVWTSGAHIADFGILLARTAPDRPKHSGITYFLCDMRQPGVEVRPLRQLTGEAEFNEVFLTDVRIPDTFRLGAEGEGWRVAGTTLNNERVSIGGAAAARESGMLGVVAATWRGNPQARTPALQDRLLRLWVEAEAARLAAARHRHIASLGKSGPEGAALKLTFAKLNQDLSSLELDLIGDDALRYADWQLDDPHDVDLLGRHAGYRYLRAKGNSIEGGTSEILRNIVAERVLGLPSEARPDKNAAWKDIAR